jgi:hypothetical protein
MWTENEIKKLRKHAFDVFKTEIPLSAEIEKIQIFLDQSGFEFKRESPTLVKTVGYQLRWLPNFWHFPLEIDLPNDVLLIIRESCKTLLDNRCYELAGLCGYRLPEDGDSENPLNGVASPLTDLGGGISTDA